MGRRVIRPGMEFFGPQSEESTRFCKGRLPLRRLPGGPVSPEVDLVCEAAKRRAKATREEFKRLWPEWPAKLTSE